MSKIVAVYTGQGLSGPLQAEFKAALPDCEFVNIIDDSIIRDVGKAGGITPDVSRRLTGYFAVAQDIGADIIVNTCSSVRDIVDFAEPMIRVPIVRIDDEMGNRAVAEFSSVAVIATLPTTLKPTMAMLENKAKAANKALNVVSGLAEGAYDALVGGSPEKHDQLILETAQKLAESVDGFVLAQGSMGRMQKALEEAAGKPVLASPPLCVQQVVKMLEGK